MLKTKFQVSGFTGLQNTSKHEEMRPKSKGKVHSHVMHESTVSRGQKSEISITGLKPRC